MKQAFDANLIAGKITQFSPNVHTFFEVSSTNDLMKQAAAEGAPEGTVYLAERQTCGRGRYGRSFVSNSGGVYMSLLLRPELIPSELPLITPIAAVAVAEAIKETCGINAQIKWVNDVYIGGKKACGILCESLLSQSGTATVVGIGINVGQSIAGLPDDLARTVTSLPDTCNKSLLAAAVLDRFFCYYKDFSSKKFVKKYAELCFVTGKNISVIKNGQSLPAVANSLSPELGLNVTYPDGSTETLTAGEVSIKI